MYYSSGPNLNTDYLKSEISGLYKANTKIETDISQLRQSIMEFSIYKANAQKEMKILSKTIYELIEENTLLERLVGELETQFKSMRKDLTFYKTNHETLEQKVKKLLETAKKDTLLESITPVKTQAPQLNSHRSSTDGQKERTPIIERMENLKKQLQLGLEDSRKKPKAIQEDFEISSEFLEAFDINEGNKHKFLEPNIPSISKIEQEPKSDQHSALIEKNLAEIKTMLQQITPNNLSSSFNDNILAHYRASSLFIPPEEDKFQHFSPSQRREHTRSDLITTSKPPITFPEEQQFGGMYYTDRLKIQTQPPETLPTSFKPLQAATSPTIQANREPVEPTNSILVENAFVPDTRRSTSSQNTEKLKKEKTDSGNNLDRGEEGGNNNSRGTHTLSETFQSESLSLDGAKDNAEEGSKSWNPPPQFYQYLKTSPRGSNYTDSGDARAMYFPEKKSAKYVKKLTITKKSNINTSGKSDSSFAKSPSNVNNTQEN